jgi:hypothetical protein
MPSWDELLNDVEATLASYEGVAVDGNTLVEFVLPADMPVIPLELLPRVEQIQARIAALSTEHEKALAALRPSLAVVSRPSNSRTGDLLNELA